MKRSLLSIFLGILALMVTLSGCGNEQRASGPSEKLSESGKSESGTAGESSLQIQIQANGQSIVFELNGSPAAHSLYNQLPLTTTIENFGSNEKIFYPPQELETTDTPLAEGPAGTLAYYEPWGDVAIFYGECNGGSGLYELGKAISGEEQIESLTGEIRIEKHEEAVKNEEIPSSQQPEDTSLSQAPQSQEEALESENIISYELESRPASQTIQSQSGVSEAEASASTEPETQVTAENTQPPIEQQEQSEQLNKEQNVRKMKVQVENSVFEATLEHNQAADAFMEMMENGPVILTMRDYAGFEKVGSLGTNLPTSNSQTTTQAGDIVLYNGNQIVIFYGSNSWSYTRLGKIDDLSGWEDALGNGEVTVTFSLD